MHRITLFIVGSILLLSACTQRLTCPAFQSAYIYDKEALRKKFSYFNEDSTPKILTASKDKHLIAVSESYRKKMRSLRTVEMTPIYPVIPDSLKVDEGADLILAERDEPDSTAVQSSGGLERTDSAYAITKTKEKFNVDQDNYMWYFRDVLVMPDVRAALDQKKGDKGKQSKAAATEDEPKRRKGLFNRKGSDSTSVNSPAIPPDDSTSSNPRKKVKAPKQKKVKKKKVMKKEEPKKDPPAKKEEEDDGFN